jgi:tetratricopeptide (TPR) repeat protein
MKMPAPLPFRQAGMGLALLLCAGAPISCASQSTRTEQQVRATASIEDPIRVLQARAELETLKPLPAADDSLIRELILDNTPRLTPGTEEHRRALMGADEIVIASTLPETAEQPEIDPRRRGHSAKLYARARLLRQQGRLEDAARVLEQATELDPGSASLAAALGEVRVDMGDSVGAGSAYERAIELGDRSGTTLVYVASQAYTLGSDDRVMMLCTLALDAEAEDMDPVARVLAGIMLGNAQIRLGYLRAGAESLERSLDAFDPSIRDPRWRQETIQILGRRAALWIVAGDAWSTVGAHTRAADAYAQAAALSEGAAGSLTARQIAAKLRDGHPASAALLLVDHLGAHTGDIGWQEARWVRTLCKVQSLRGVLNDAIAGIRSQPGLPASVRRSLLILEVQGVDADDAIGRLGAAGPDASEAQAIMPALGSIQNIDEQHEWASRLLAANPHAARALAEALVSTPAPPLGRLRELDTDSVPEQLLSASLALRLGRADLLTHLDELGPEVFTARSNAWLEAHAQACALTGRWERAAALDAELAQRTAQGDRDAARAHAATLLLMQQPKRAQESAVALCADDAVITDDLKLLARIALNLEEPQTAIDALNRARLLDPFDASISDRLIRLQGNGGPSENEDALREVVRDLGVNRPRSDLFVLLRAGDLARNGLMREAESMLLDLNARRRSDLTGEDLLLSIWKTRETQGDENALLDGAAWLEQRLVDAPNSVRAGLALAQICYELGAHQESYELLTDLWERTGSFEVARVREGLLASELEQPEQSRSLVDQRLSTLRGIDPAIEYALALAQRADARSALDAVAVLSQRIPADARLLPSQSRQLAQVVYTMSEQAETEGIDDAMLAIVALIEDRAGPLNFFMARTKILLLSRRPRIDIDELLSVVEHHASTIEDPNDASTLRALPVQVLLGEDRPHEAIAIVTRLAIDGSTLNDEALIELFRLLGAVGVNSDLLGAMDTFEAAGVMQSVIEITTRRLGTPQRPIQGLTSDEQRADLAYTAGAMASAFERADQSEAYLTLALSFDPDHGWSNNDLGYMLTERGERIEDAAIMLETAARVLPNEASVIDSLGWLRYKQGIFEDEIDPQTNEVTRRGAISILARANRLDLERGNATILSHLGDSLWRAGQQDKAVEAWLGGESMLRSRIRALGAQPEPNRRAIDAASAELRELRYRIQDAEAGGTPDIAPIFEDPGSN